MKENPVFANESLTELVEMVEGLIAHAEKKIKQAQEKILESEMAKKAAKRNCD